MADDNGIALFCWLPQAIVLSIRAIRGSFLGRRGSEVNPSQQFESCSGPRPAYKMAGVIAGLER